MKEKITIYTNETCPYCDKIKTQLKEKGVEFIERQTKDWKEEYGKITYATGIPTVPTVLYHNTYFVPGRDFQNPEQLVELLNNFEKPDLDSNTLVLEKLKTLNYNIMMMLHNLNTELRQINNNLNKEESGNKSTS